MISFFKNIKMDIISCMNFDQQWKIGYINDKILSTVAGKFLTLDPSKYTISYKLKRRFSIVYHNTIFTNADLIIRCVVHQLYHTYYDMFVFHTKKSEFDMLLKYLHIQKVVKYMVNSRYNKLKYVNIYRTSNFIQGIIDGNEHAHTFIDTLVNKNCSNSQFLINLLYTLLI